jgi:hypothetical protein
MLSRFLSRNMEVRLKDLDLSNNNIDDIGASYLAQCFYESRPALNSFEIKHNNISHVGFAVLLPSFHIK